MRRLAALTVVLVAILAGVVGLPALARPDGGPYTVRAIFDDASFAAIGEDVRVAGANVGSISGLGVTDDERAAVTITINDSRFAPFYANARCEIRPQSLIGEEYVDCTPGTSSVRPLHHIMHGPGAGDYLLPVTHTSSPIDTDIVQDISSEPVRESLAVVINELGTGLAARGSDLNAVIHRANPALGDTDRVVRILDRQDHTLAALARSSNQVLAPLARERTQLAGFVTHADTTAVASAQRAADISRTFREFPSFLRQLRPLMADLGSLSDQGTPVMRELGGSASALGRQFAELTPFAKAARTSLVNLGQAARQSQQPLVDSEPVVRRLEHVGRETRPAAGALAALLQSLNRTGGIEDLMTLLYRGVAAGNGFDSLGHYVRVNPITGPCTFYSRSPSPICQSSFSNGHSAAARRAPSARPTAVASPLIVNRALRAVSGRGSPVALTGLLGYLMGGKG